MLLCANIEKFSFFLMLGICCNLSCARVDLDKINSRELKPVLMKVSQNKLPLKYIFFSSNFYKVILLSMCLTNFLRGHEDPAVFVFQICHNFHKYMSNFVRGCEGSCWFCFSQLGHSVRQWWRTAWTVVLWVSCNYIVTYTKCNIVSVMKQACCVGWRHRPFPMQLQQ